MSSYLIRLEEMTNSGANGRKTTVQNKRRSYVSRWITLERGERE